MRVAVASDHAGFQYKRVLVEDLRRFGYRVLDLGTHSEEAVDYPDSAEAVAEAILQKKADRGLLICGSAVGVSVAANKFPGIRAGVCHDTYSAGQAVEHDDANVLCLGQRVIGLELARRIVAAFFEARFSRAARHRRRLKKLRAIEEKNFCRPEEES